MKTIIYIRHGHDKRSRHKHDEKLTRKGKKAISSLTLDLIDKYGIPDRIYISPFHRTRQTLKEMLKTITTVSNQKIYKEIDPRLGRFFTKKQSRYPEIRKSTEESGAIILETGKEFRERVENQLEEISSQKGEVVWNITHTLVLLHIARIKNLTRNPHIEYLDTVIIQE